MIDHLLSSLHELPEKRMKKQDALDAAIFVFCIIVLVIVFSLEQQ